MRFPEPPIIIGGCGRSGTTLVASILSCHPRIAVVGPETRAFAAGAYPSDRPPRPFTPFRLGALEAELAHAPGTALRWCEKTPRNIHAFPHLHATFEGRVKLIHVVRDGRDVVCSFHPDDPLQPWISPERWVEDVRAGLAAAEACPVHVVRYEDLATRFEPTVRALAEFIGEPDPAPMLAYPRGATLVEHAAWAEPARPVSAASVGRWRAAANAPYVQALLRHPDASRLLAALGYDVAAGGPARADGSSAPTLDAPYDRTNPPPDNRAGPRDARGVSRPSGLPDARAGASEPGVSSTLAAWGDDARPGAAWTDVLAELPRPIGVARVARAGLARRAQTHPTGLAPRLERWVARLPGRNASADHGARPVFVVGPPASGVETMAGLLAAHPELHVFPADARVIERVAPSAVPDAYRRLAEAAGVPRGVRWVDPDPDNLLHARALLAAFPQARFFVVTRAQERAEACLTGRMGWRQGARRRLAEATAVGLEVAGWPEALLVEDEALRGDAQATLQRVLRFLGLGWDGALDEALTRFAPHLARRL